MLKVALTILGLGLAYFGAVALLLWFARWTDTGRDHADATSAPKRRHLRAVKAAEDTPYIAAIQLDQERKA